MKTPKYAKPKNTMTNFNKGNYYNIIQWVENDIFFEVINKHKGRELCNKSDFEFPEDIFEEKQ